MRFAGCGSAPSSRSISSSALSGRTIADTAGDADVVMSGRLGVPSDDATGDERDELDADASGGVPPPLALPLPLPPPCLLLPTLAPVVLTLALALLRPRALVGSLT